MLKHGKQTLAVVAVGLVLSLAITGTSLAAKGGNGGGGGKPGGGGGGELIPLKLILLAGQSNMRGAGLVSDLDTLAPELLAPQTDVRIWYEGSWKDLQPGLGYQADRFGPELMFGRAMADALPNENIAVIKAGFAGNSLALDWDPITPGASWVAFLDGVSSALSTVDATVYRPEIVGMIWAQGARDSQFEEQALVYEENLTNFIQAIRVEFGKPNLPFVLAQTPDLDPALWPQLIYLSVIREAQWNVFQTVPNTGLVFTEGITFRPDGGHYDAAGQLDFGARFAAEFLATAAFVPVAVDAVTYATAGKRGRDLVVSVDIVELSGPSVNTFVSVRLDHESGRFWEAIAMTDVDGNISFPLSRAPSGSYTTTVTKLTISNGLGDWDEVTPLNGFTK